MARNNRTSIIAEAVKQEQINLNTAIKNGAKVYLKTFNGEYLVKFVSPDFWYHTDGGGFGQSWCGCNDGAWANLLKQAGVSRALPEWDR